MYVVNSDADGATICCSYEELGLVARTLGQVSNEAVAEQYDNWEHRRQELEAVEPVAALASDFGYAHRQVQEHQPGGALAELS